VPNSSKHHKSRVVTIFGYKSKYVLGPSDLFFEF
jgi:hypothetical protein